MSTAETDPVVGSSPVAAATPAQQPNSLQGLAQRRAEQHQHHHKQNDINSLSSSEHSQFSSDRGSTPPLTDPKISLPGSDSKDKFSAIDDSPQATSSSKPRSKMSSEYDPFAGLSFKVGVAENKNSTYRSKMEDVHTYIANFAERVDWGYFAIFDGHAGKESARWCGNNLHSLLEQEIDLELQEQKDMSETNTHTGQPSDSDTKDHLYKTFIKADEIIEKNAIQGGCTAAVAVLRWESEGSENGHKRMLYTSNVGDSRIVLSRKGKAYRLSYDHKASDKNEIDRVESSGGLILKNRVNGVLAVTRSLGDSYMKDLVLGKPFTTSTQITKDDEFMILACDGVWDVISDAKACKIAADCFKNGLDAQEASRKLCQSAIDASTTDNVTVMVVQFDQGVFD
ncbi:MgPP2CL-1 [Candida theae]|uniref:MgPP2CL-1 n=1 Tax=Candida theae TaxID=1198502 RepID=A0AAD5FYX1_9ASCO|nr:MgPP2CL-1 [Candida theae]KAI5958794.1 MgPP2CL-1 [Candida theae]